MSGCCHNQAGRRVRPPAVLFCCFAEHFPEAAQVFGQQIGIALLILMMGGSRLAYRAWKERYVIGLNKLDAKKAVNLIRTMLPAKKIYVNEDVNSLVMRDTPDAIEIARKILEANDIPDAELVLDVEIVEISKSNVDNFGLVLSKYQVATAANAGVTLEMEPRATCPTNKSSGVESW